MVAAQQIPWQNWPHISPADYLVIQARPIVQSTIAAAPPAPEPIEFNENWVAVDVVLLILLVVILLTPTVRDEDDDFY
jgi:hypothetical protein